MRLEVQMSDDRTDGPTRQAGDDYTAERQIVTPYRRTFISYAHEDQQVARQLATALTRHGVSVWFDEWEIDRIVEGQAVFESVRLALSQCDAIVSLATPTYSDRVTVQTDHPIPYHIPMQAGGWPRSKYLAYEASIWSADLRRNSGNFTAITLRLGAPNKGITAPTITRGIKYRGDVPARDTTPAYSYFVYAGDGDEAPKGYRDVGRLVEISTASHDFDVRLVLAELRA
jgi:hypothetical protein